MKIELCKTGLQAMLLGAVALGPLMMTGCQGTYGGQTLPSPYYLRDDIQHFPKGPEFKLSNEAAAMREYKEEQERLGN
ncbi:MAG TPA: hypothetical protein DCQ98_21105 [Planctomycetaceae bacterium]|nr:hypothetical protein [Planctomycetaceae bacterium]HRE99081.1 hypothetical protein [Pirellulaceae bacterium]